MKIFSFSSRIIKIRRAVISQFSRLLNYVLFFTCFSFTKKRIFTTITILIWSTVCFSQNCQNTDLEKYHHQMQLYIQKLEANKAISYSDSILMIVEDKNLHNCEKTLWILFDRSEAMELNNLYEEALDIDYKIVRLAEINKWWALLAQTHISIARCFEKIGRSGDCLQQLDVAKQIIVTHELDTVYARYCLRYSSYHRIYGDQDSAKIYALQSIRLGKKFNVDRSVFDGHLLMGILSKDIDSSIFHFQRAVDIYLERGDYNGAASQSLNIANRLSKKNRYNEAWKEIKQSEFYLSKMEEKTANYFRLLSLLNEQKRLIYEHRGILDSAYHHLKLAFEYAKKSGWVVNQENITENAIDFAIEKEKEKFNYERQISLVLKVGLAGMGFLMLILSWAFFSNRKKQKQIELQNQLIISKNESLNQGIHKQAILLSEIHHRVKNNLQVVISLLTLEAAKSNNQNVDVLLDEIAGKVKSIALIHDQLYSSGDFEKINLKNYITDLLTYFQDLQVENIRFEYELDFENTFLNIETVFPIGIICTELINNSLKYAVTKKHNLKICIDLKLFNNKYILKFKDNGPGYKEKIETRSQQKMGFSIIQNMIRQLHAEYTQYNDQGAVFTILFEEKQVSVI